MTKEPAVIKFGFNYMLRLAFKDMLFNKKSSVLLIAVVCFVCLPLLILGTLKEKYLDYLRKDIEINTQAKRIEAVVSRPGEIDFRIDNSWVEKAEKRKDVDTVIPHRTRSILIQDEYGDLIDFEAVSTISKDPDLKRYGFKGSFPDDKKAVILHKNHFKELGISPDTKELSIIVIRTLGRIEQKFIITCKLAGFVTMGDRRIIYIPLELADDLENWRKGYPVPDLGLPAAKNKEMALEDPFYTSAKLFLTSPIDDRGISALRTYKLKHSLLQQESSDNLFTYLLTFNDKKAYTQYMWFNVSDSLIGLGNPLLVPQIEPVTLKLDNNEISLLPTTIDDPRSGILLKSGRWLNSNDNTFDVILPKNALNNPASFPVSLELKISNIVIPVNVVGFSNTSFGYALPKLLFRTNDLIKDKINFDVKGRSFYPKSSEPTYIVARIHAKSLDDIESVCSWIEEQGLTCFSVREAIEQMRKINSMITNLMILIGSTGLLAVICAIIGIMYEAISRKRKQIGIMRTMGVSRNNIFSIYLMQATIYGFFGYISVCLIQAVLAQILDTSWGHTLLGINIPDPLFNASWSLRFSFGGVLIFLCIIAGSFPAYSAGKVEPGVVLSE